MCYFYAINYKSNNYKYISNHFIIIKDSVFLWGGRIFKKSSFFLQAIEVGVCVPKN